jgi:hypothetical protein
MSETGSERVAPAESQPQRIEVPDWVKTGGAPVEIQPDTNETGFEDDAGVDPFSNGKEITVMRNANVQTGAPAYLEGGWKVIDDQAVLETKPGSGKWMSAVRVEKEIDGAPNYKVIPLETVYALNRTETAEAPEVRETPPLTEVQEDIADEAIEAVLGIEDPSEIDEHAHDFSPSELRTMREAAQRVSSINPETDNRPDAYTYLKEVLPPVTRGDSEASRKYYDKFVTEENRQGSLDFLSEAVKADKRIAAILENAGLASTDMAAVDAIRENPDVRYEVAKRLTQKLDVLVSQDPEGFGYRIADNSPNNLKVDPQTGKRMRSRMYAVDMALKMLGGEFSERNETKDFARDKNDRVAVGQHRHAATTTIMSWQA